ncbi:hypothetical protein L873DRAFT_31622 [Choiromyces venosus 120613-1]|uniref:Uncharacterized protein n=1 Tax=Choiromyces venosus 120613-1 TaxID=1336337 RepID=A0A3N4K9T8_9PEZI|nr:hypothetical protein L873DRAFT_31622 [Choiromyces venosus 120613-1]
MMYALKEIDATSNKRAPSYFSDIGIFFFFSFFFLVTSEERHGYRNKNLKHYCQRRCLRCWVYRYEPEDGLRRNFTPQGDFNSSRQG